MIPEHYQELKKFLVLGIIAAIVYAIGGPVGLGIMALFLLLKKY